MICTNENTFYNALARWKKWLYFYCKILVLKRTFTSDANQIMPINFRETLIGIIMVIKVRWQQHTLVLIRNLDTIVNTDGYCIGILVGQEQ